MAVTFFRGLLLLLPASILFTGQWIHEFRLVTFVSYAQGTVSYVLRRFCLIYPGLSTVVILVVTMHRAHDRANPPRPPASILCTGQRIHEFRLVTPSILCTGHSFLKFRAGFSILFLRTYDSRHSRCHYAQGRHYAHGTGIMQTFRDYLCQ